MGKASASKKIKRVQAAGVSRSPGQRRNIAFPALIVGILIVGSLLTFFARDYRKGERADAPVVNKDHWHAAFAVQLCGLFQDNEPAPDNSDGIHIHSDKLIHIHPYVKDAAGKNATFGVFARNADIKLGDGKFTLANGKTYANGDKCTDEAGKETKGRVALYVWPPQATSKTKPEVYTEDIGKVRFAEQGMAFVLSFGPEGTEPKLPPTIGNLQNPNDSDEAPAETTTTAPGTSTPDTSTPDTSTPDTSAPDTSAPETSEPGATSTTTKSGD